MQWTVLIPAKALPEAKSRLAPMSSDPAAHGRLVDAIRTDTVTSALAAAGVTRVVLVVDRDAQRSGGYGETLVIMQGEPGLDAAIREGAAHAAQYWPGDGIAALVGDLPALRPEDLADALVLAAAHERAFVADASGTGTTLLTALPGVAADPAFGAGSARRHARRATSIQAAASLRVDVDTEADLLTAAELGVGPATGAELMATGVMTSSPGTGIVNL